MPPDSPLADDWWSRVSEHLERVIALPPDARAGHLEAIGKEDQALRVEVESLVAAFASEKGRFAEPALGRFTEIGEGGGLTIGDTLGPYKIVREIGRGGMGAVYEAIRVDGDFQKRVAIKTVTHERIVPGLLQRFRRERRILARLEHRHIAALVDGGVLPNGAPYFAMEYVEGVPIDDYCSSRDLSLNARLQLMRQVCGAVQFAHQNLVVHRDLKPGNILVTADGTVKLLDFGIAKLLSHEDTTGPTPEDDQTAVGTGPFTLAYASPEQVLGEPVTTASDVHALGVVLFKMLTGRHPWRSEGMAPPELRARVLDTAPPTAGHGRDVDAVLAHALHKDPSRRYASAGELGEDIRRLIAGLPVEARPDSVGYRVSKFVRRHRGPVSVAAAAVVLLFGATMISIRQARVAAAERDRAQLEAAKANRVTGFVQEMLRSADPREARPDVTVAEALAAATRRADSSLAAEPEVLSAVHTAIGLSYMGLGRYDDAKAPLQRALDLRRGLGPSGAGEAAASMRHLALLYSEQGAMAPAESLFRASLSVYRGAPSVDSAGLAATLNDLSDLLQFKGDLEGAEALQREALDIRMIIDGPRSASVATSLNNLGVINGQRENWVAAESLQRRAVDIVGERLGKTHPDYAAGLNALAFVVQAQKRLAPAESLYREALAIRESTLGADHPETARTYMNLGWLMHDRGNHEQAIDAAQRVLSARAAMGDDHPVVGSTLVMMGQSQLRLNRVNDAETSIRDALRVRSAALPRTHWLVASTESALGEVLTVKRRYADAERLLLGALQRLRAQRGEDAEATVQTRQRLVTLYERWGKPSEAAKYQRQLR